METGNITPLLLTSSLDGGSGQLKAPASLQPGKELSVHPGYGRWNQEAIWKLWERKEYVPPCRRWIMNGNFIFFVREFTSLSVTEYDFLDNAGSLTSHNPIGLQGLLRG
jgi:hypothetical protein